jgi:hypothetical protein
MRTGKGFLARGGAVLVGALLLAWPAVYNGFPLLYPDSMTYLGDGAGVARAVFFHQFSNYYGLRSLLYSLVILPFHWNVNPWPVVGLQSLLAAWVLWLVVRSIAPQRPVGGYLLLMLPLSLLTSISWYAAFIMPDILGPLLFLAFYLLVYGSETLSKAERLGLAAFACWAVTAHSTHLMLAAFLCLLFTATALLERLKSNRPSLRQRWRSLAQVAAIVVVAAGSQLALYNYLDGKPSLNGERPPYLMARIIADGPGRQYLYENCAHLDWAVCAHLSSLSDDADDFLWSPDGVYESSSDGEQSRMRQEELPLVLATLHRYPREQLARSMANFRNQLGSFGLYGFDDNPWMRQELAQRLPSAQAAYLKSRQAQATLPMDLFTSLQFWTVLASLAVVGTLMLLRFKQHSHRLATLALIVAAMVAANAFLTGVLSMVDDRYGCRIMWMIPLLAGLFLLEAWAGLKKRSGRIG